ncbi:MAG: membrane dipeptidase [Parachlamydiales bacterium]|nr:membrane dipeptidase [Parachlamydiales bacterium]
MTMPIFDLHCDLLSYLEQDIRRTPYDLDLSCGYNSFKKGGVKWQLLAIFTETNDKSTLSGMKQCQLYQDLLTLPHFCSFNSEKGQSDKDTVCIKAAVENASGFFEEDEPINQGLMRFNDANQRVGGFAYVSLTWNGGNRFGGGCGDNRPLTNDGKILINYLADTGIAIDLSHTSDALLDSIMNYIDTYQIRCKLLASHSNMRSINDSIRNLPDRSVKEIIRRDGLMGINLFRQFIGNHPDRILDHVKHALDMGALNHLSFGADFFHAPDHPRLGDNKLFFDKLSDASCYPHLIDQFKNKLVMSDEDIKLLAYQNALKFFS